MTVFSKEIAYAKFFNKHNMKPVSRKKFKYAQCLDFIRENCVSSILLLLVFITSTKNSSIVWHIIIDTIIVYHYSLTDYSVPVKTLQMYNLAQNINFLLSNILRINTQIFVIININYYGILHIHFLFWRFFCLI